MNDAMNKRPNNKANTLNSFPKTTQTGINAKSAAPRIIFNSPDKRINQ